MGKRNKPYCGSGATIYVLQISSYSKYPPTKEGGMPKFVLDYSVSWHFTNLDKAYKMAVEVVGKERLHSYQTVLNRLKSADEGRKYVKEFYDEESSANDPYYDSTHVLIGTLTVN